MEEIITVKIKKESCLDLLVDFKGHLEAIKKPVYNTSAFNSAFRNRTFSDDRKIFFYEFSNLKNQPKFFEKVSAFMEWAKSVNIFISSYTENELRTHEINFATCYPKSATLMVRETYELLEKSFNTYGRSPVYSSGRDYYNDWD